MLLISIIISIALIYTCTKSLNVIFRLSTILFYITSILFIISIIGLINQININHLVPVNDLNINCIYTLPIFVLLMIPKQEILNNNKLNKYILIFYIIGNIIKILVVLFTILVLGIELTNFYNFPEFVVLSRISTTGFFQRFEGILGIEWIYIIFIMLCINFYYIKNLYIHLFNKYKDIFIIILIIITAIICI
jgi:spore germination protein KB